MSCHELRLSRDVKKHEAETKNFKENIDIMPILITSGKRLISVITAALEEVMFFVLPLRFPAVFSLLVIENCLKSNFKAFSHRSAIY